VLILTAVAPQAVFAQLPRIRIVETGGSIAASVKYEGDDRVRFGVDRLLRVIPEAARYASVEREEFARVGSAHIDPPEWLRLSQRLNTILQHEPQVEGIVVTHGSNTVEETAYFLHLTVRSDRPVVITASQRKLDEVGTDGPKNLLDAIRVAASAEARGRGVLLVANETIQSARDVTKTISYRPETWQSRDLGNLGYVDRDQVTFYRNATRRHTVRSEFDVGSISELPRVDILHAYPGADGALMAFAAKRLGAAGLVVATFPTGRLTPKMEEAARALVDEGVAVVRAHRGGVGRVERSPGPLIEADNLTPQKARILLMLGLTLARGPDELQRLFDTY
jgi:L-asparaginase